MAESVQITIPDLGGDDYASTPVSFGRSAIAGLWNVGGGSGSGQDSPVMSTPSSGFEKLDKIVSHSRNNSVASEDSFHSSRYTTSKSTTPLAHSSQSSIATTTSTSPFTKKTSFASLRNAFKHGKASEPPPVPQIDHNQAYPVLKNPFNRSTTSVAPRPSVGASPPHARPQTSGSGAEARAIVPRGRSKTHTYGGRSQQSFSGSVFHHSDTGSDQGHQAFMFSPPPMPKVPPGGQFVSAPLRESPPSLADVEEKISMDPRTPSDYALHAVFIRFATAAEIKIDTFLRNQGLDNEPLLPDVMGPEIDPKFDEVLQSLGRIAQKHAKAVIDSIMRWRRSQNEAVPPASAQPTPRGARPLENSLERRSIASLYIMCRALIAVLRLVSKDALGEALGLSLEETTFEQFRNPDFKLLAQSANYRSNAELFASLLGHIANIRFASVSDRFLAELTPITLGQVFKDTDSKYENLVSGLSHIQIKVWPNEAFVEGAEFMASLAKSFENAHGLRLKTAYAKTLVQLLHPIAKTAQDEVNDPQWQQAIELIFPKAKDMMNKPRYWHVAYPLIVTSLCVAPHKFFLKNWTACLEASLSKLKEKQFRTIAMNGMMRLLWTYLYRSRESPSTITSKLDVIMKHFFPINRITVFPHDDNLVLLVYIVHFVLTRFPDYGRDLCLELLQENSIKISPITSISQLLAPDRMNIVIQAILLSLYLVEKDSQIPMWPSSADFSIIPAWEDYPTSSGFAPPSLLAKPGMAEFFDRFGTVLACIAISCGNAIVAMSVFDDQWSTAKLSPAYEETHNYVIRRHAEGSFAYSNQLVSQISMLQACFQSWPRCLHPNVALNDAIDILIRGVVHIEPFLAEAACGALRRFMVDSRHALIVLSRYTPFLFDARNVTAEGAGTKLVLEHTQLLGLWVSLVDGWIQDIMQRSVGTVADEERMLILSRINEIEAGTLLLLSYDSLSIRSVGVNVVRMIKSLLGRLNLANPSLSDSARDLRALDLLHGTAFTKKYFEGYEDLLEQPEIERIGQWRQSNHADVLLRIADSNDEQDRKLWRFVFPAFMQFGPEPTSQVVSSFRETLVAAATLYHPSILLIAGLSSKVPAGLTSRGSQEKDGYRLLKENRHIVDQWHLWMKILCATAIQSSKPALTQLGREHNRTASDVNFDRERMTTTRGLFRYLTPFLDSEYTQFRDAAVLCISSLPSSAYPQLLEDLGLLKFYDEPKIKSGSSLGRSRRQERLYSAVARIYYLTSPFLQHQRSTNRQTALTHVLKFLRSTHAFLISPEMRDNHALQRLRRYFCGTIEHIFDGLVTIKDVDRFIPHNMPLSLFRLCEEWCQYGRQSDAARQRLALMQRTLNAAPGLSHDAVERFRREVALLSEAAAGALTSLCAKAYFPLEQPSSTQEDSSNVEVSKALDPVSTIDRLSAVISSDNVAAQARGRKAIRSLLNCGIPDTGLRDKLLRRALVISSKLESSHARIFTVLSEVICSVPSHHFSFSQAVCLGLSNLCHPVLEIRRHAFNVIEAIHEQSAGILSMSQFEATVGSSSPSIYYRAHSLISDFLAGEHPLQANHILSQFSSWLSQYQDGESGKISLLLLQALEHWVSNIDLMGEDKLTLKKDGHTALYHLVALTLRFGDSHAEQVLTLWTRLVDSPHQSNGHAAIRFMLEQSHKVGSTSFISCAANIVACLSQTLIGRQIFDDLCGVIEPVRMLPTIDHKLSLPDAAEIELWSDLDALFADQPRLSLGAAQYALLFLADVALERQWEAQEQLPVLLHAIFTHLDHRVPFVRQQTQRMLFQLLRSWAPGYDELPNRSELPSRMALRSSLASLEKEALAKVWQEDETSAESEPKMRWLCDQVVRFLDPLASRLTDRWGSLALSWGTACSIRAVAFRSLQIFRALRPKVTKSDLACLLGRLSNTIAAPDENIRSFTSEILLTLNSISEELESSLLPQMFWCACACLSTPVESEFGQVLSLFEVLLKRLDLGDPRTIDLLVSHRPVEWVGDHSFQSSLLVGLRSASTSEHTMKILRTLAKVSDGKLIDSTEGRLRDLYTVCLPWCLHGMNSDIQDQSLQELAGDLARLAEREGRESIVRIMTSFVKGRFRTKDDFLRQSVASLREHYVAQHWTETVTVLLRLLLNRESWLRVHTMQMLKLLFQRREPRNPVEYLGSELLMPLLRLLETDLAPQALDVLEEPVTISGGPAAKHVLRMSLSAGGLLKDVSSMGEVFGVPEESGWCVAQVDRAREVCRSNVVAVFDSCKIASRPSRIDFEPEVEALIAGPAVEEDLGGLVQNLHELTTFFQEEQVPKMYLSVPSQQLEARVAAILAKSTAVDAVTDTPQTPYLDVFRVESMIVPEDLDDESETDSDDDDAFIFDSPTIYRDGRVR